MDDSSLEAAFKRVMAFSEQSKDHSSLRLDKLLAQYFDEQTLRPDSRRSYSCSLNVFIKDNNIQSLHEVNEDMLLKWKKNVLERASPTTWNNDHTHLRALFSFATRKKWLDDNPFLAVTKVKPPQLKKKTIELSSLKMMLETLNEFKENFEPKWFWVTLIKVFYYTGIRQHQILTLKWQDINFTEETILLTVEGSKTHREWAIPLPDECHEILKTLKTDRKAP